MTDWISAASDAIMALATIIAVGLALREVRRWRLIKAAEIDIEMIRKALAATSITRQFTVYSAIVSAQAIELVERFQKGEIEFVRDHMRWFDKKPDVSAVSEWSVNAQQVFHELDVLWQTSFTHVIEGVDTAVRASDISFEQTRSFLQRVPDHRIKEYCNSQIVLLRKTATDVHRNEVKVADLERTLVAILHKIIDINNPHRKEIENQIAASLRDLKIELGETYAGSEQMIRDIIGDTVLGDGG